MRRESGYNQSVSLFDFNLRIWFYILAKARPSLRHDVEVVPGSVGEYEEREAFGPGRCHLEGSKGPRSNSEVALWIGPEISQ